MSLAPGTKLGPYEIVGPLGAGGMGEVYRARDTRLGRDVAVKVVPSHLSQRPETRERFEREARAISSLNHPHICTLYDVGREGDADYFVMELLEGESLAKRLERGPLKLDEALKVAAQVADGLAEAHRHGIVHRDLKPANVVLTKAGAKILDFGVAKLRDDRVSETMTRTTPLTSAGSMVGTVQYMAPEQLEGKPVDHRADLFALGAVIHEMVTGKRAFDGTSQASIIAAILKEDPRGVSELVPVAPASLDRVVKSCLAKDPADRWQDAADLARELRWIAEGKETAAAAPARGGRAVLPWAVAAVATVVAVALAVAAWRRPPPAAHASLVAAVMPPPGLGLSTDSFGEDPIALSPDGTRLAMCLHEGEGPNAIWIRTLATGEFRKLEGTEGAAQPFWSPDGHSLGFMSFRKLRRVDLAGGAVLALADVRELRGGSWAPDGTIVFTPEAESPVKRVPAGGGKVEDATTLKGDEATHRFPYFLPDGEHILYLSRDAGAGAGQSAAIWVESLKSHERKRLIEIASSVAYASGHLVYVKQGVLVAQRFDPGRLELEGDAVPLAKDVRMDTRFSRGQFTVSSEGTLAYVAGALASQAILEWRGRDGKPLQTLGDPADFFANGVPHISPDGRSAVVVIVGANGKSDVWRVNLESGLRSRVTIDDDNDHFGGTWSPDGARLAINGGDREGNDWVGITAADGSGSVTRVFESKRALPYPLVFSRDGRQLFVGYNDRKSPENKVVVVDLGGGRPPAPLTDRPGFTANPVLSPDGRFVAYSNDGSGRDEIYVAPYPGGGRLWQVSQSGGVEPRWSRDGKELFYIDRDNWLQSVAVNASGDSFEAGAVRPLFRLAAGWYLWRYDVAPGATKFLVCPRLDDGTRSGATLVTDWTSNLTSRR